MASWKERVDRHEREIAAIRKLIHKGMKMFVKAEEEHAAFRKELRELAAQQRATARELEAFIRSLRRGSNGHTKRAIL
jgi:predicted  nucleic acid-binding Zn-ribbon protein